MIGHGRKAEQWDGDDYLSELSAMVEKATVWSLKR